MLPLIIGVGNVLSVHIIKQLHNFKIETQWSVKKGEIVALFGPSGAGKTLSLKCISGLEVPDTGKIILNGKKLFDSDNKINIPPQKRKVGYLPQNYGLFPHMSLIDNVKYGIQKSNPVNPSELVELLQKLELEKFKYHYPHQLSGGQQQRVSLLRAMVTKPEILLLDEPFSAIDGFLRAKIREELREFLKEFHLPIVLVTHDPLDIEDLGARVIEY
jgi:molybdate transport system ATP-binding protein